MLKWRRLEEKQVGLCREENEGFVLAIPVEVTSKWLDTHILAK